MRLLLSGNFAALGFGVRVGVRVRIRVRVRVTVRVRLKVRVRVRIRLPRSSPQSASWFSRWTYIHPIPHTSTLTLTLTPFTPVSQTCTPSSWSDAPKLTAWPTHTSCRSSLTARSPPCCKCWSDPKGRVMVRVGSGSGPTRTSCRSSLTGTTHHAANAYLTLRVRVMVRVGLRVGVGIRVRAFQ